MFNPLLVAYFSKLMDANSYKFSLKNLVSKTKKKGNKDGK